MNVKAKISEIFETVRESSVGKFIGIDKANMEEVARLNLEAHIRQEHLTDEDVAKGNVYKQFASFKK